MKKSALIALLFLIAVGRTMAAGVPESKMHEATTTWGATSTDTEFPWGYKLPADPSYQGTPDYLLTSFNFPLGSASLNREAHGAAIAMTKTLGEGGDTADLNDVRLLVVGFADGVHERETAEKLGTERAERTRAMLVEMGYPRENIQIASFGARYSTATPDQKDKQGFERQAEIWVLK
jgi:outer membrane protein OmpA-like peptidoglycan-associated protein